MSLNALDLKSFTNEETFLRTTTEASRLNAPSASAIWCTIAALQALGPPSPLSFIPSHLVLVPGPTPSADSTPGTKALEYIDALVRAAHETANALACSSVLAGQASESDEFGDVGVWFDSGIFANDLSEDRLVKSKTVLSALGLDPLTSRPIHLITLSASTGLPPSFNVSESDAGASNLINLLGRLERKFAFRVEGGREAGGSVLYVLLGRLDIGDKRGWGGLVGMGTWSD